MKPASRGFLVNALLSLASVAACLVLMEIAARILLRGAGQKSTHVVRNVAPGTLGFLPNTEERYRSDEFDFLLATNRFGRRDVEWTPETIGDPQNVLFVGDSFVLGYGVDDRWALPTLLEQEFAAAGRARQVFNFGFTGSFPEYIRLTEEAVALGIEARLVLVGLFLGNDFALEPDMPAVSGAKPAAAAPGATAAPAPANPGALRAPPSPQRASRPPRSRLLQFVRERVAGSPAAVGAILTLGDWIGVPLYRSPRSFIFLRRQTEEQKRIFQAGLADLTRINTICAERGKEMVLVVFPNKIQVENPDGLRSSVYDADQPNRQIAEFCAREGIACVDVTAALRAERERRRERLYFPIDRHLNERGNEVAAETIFAYLSGRADAALEPASDAK